MVARALLSAMSEAEKQLILVPGEGGLTLRTATPSDFDIAVSEYVAHEALNLKPLTMAGALLWLGIYDEGTLEEYAQRPEFDPSVRRLKAIIRREYERRLHTGQSTGASFAMKNMGWTEKTISEITGPGGKPLKLVVEITFVEPVIG